MLLEWLAHGDPVHWRMVTQCEKHVNIRDSQHWRMVTQCKK